MKIRVLLVACVLVRMTTGLTVTEKWCRYERRRMSNPFLPPFRYKTISPRFKAPRVVPEAKITPHFRTKRYTLGALPTLRPEPSTATLSERQRSLCSWQWQLDISDTRLPRSMYKAVCHHNEGNNQCNFDFSIVNNFNTSALDHLRLETECALVKAPVHVKNECCINGTYVLREEWIDWPVACVCARKRVYIVN